MRRGGLRGGVDRSRIADQLPAVGIEGDDFERGFAEVRIVGQHLGVVIER